MTSIQKVIKYLAIAFAVFLIVLIFSSILGGLFIFAGALNLTENITKEVSTHMSAVELIKDNQTVQEILNLDVELFYTDLIIKKGNEFKIESNNSNVICEKVGNKLKIREEKQFWFGSKNTTILILFIPEDFKFENVDIVAGAGKIHIIDFSTKNLDFELGAGETLIENFYVSNKCKIEGGAGKIIISSGNINNLDLDLGVGETNISAEIIGKSEINAGVGSVNLVLDGNKEDYKFKVDKGIGSIKINDKEAENGKTYGEGINFIDIDGGIGNIKIIYKEMI